MIKIIMTVCLSLMLLSITIQPLTFAEEKPKEAAPNPCRTILETKCTTCHYLTRVCQKLGDKSRWSWKRTIKRMVSIGAKLSKEQQDELANCLYEENEGVLTLCK